MDEVKKSICFFIHYSIIDKIPYHVLIYKNELSRHFNNVKVRTNNSKIRDKKYLFNENVNIKHNENKGYVFGIFYRCIIDSKLDKYSQIAVINDSNILLNKLDLVFD